jgi:hypothetical protein
VVSSALVGLIARVAWENQGSPLPAKASRPARGPAGKPASPVEVPA